MRPAAALLLLPLCLAACAEKIPPVALGPGTPPADAGPSPTLGVLPLRDDRPELQHKGKKPMLIVLGVWNSRIGDYVTGDKAFQADVSAAVTAAVADAMGGGRYGTAIPVSGGPMEPPAACAERRLHWVATGEIRDLYGTRHQRTFFVFAWWAAAWGHKKTDPLGVARLALRVQDCGKGAVVFERDLRSENRYVKKTLSEAANLALTDVLQKLHNETLAVPATPYVPAPEEYRRDLAGPHRP